MASACTGWVTTHARPADFKSAIQQSATLRYELGRRSSLMHALALWIILFHASMLNAALAPVDLRCEYSVNPRGIDLPDPRLFWKVESDQRNQRQSAYRLLVAGSAETLARNTGDLWDSGKVASDQTVHIPYGGSPLASSRLVFWKVQVWDQDGVPSEWSAAAQWTMGLLRNEDWQGKWICAPSVSEALLLRSEFLVKPGLRRAVMHVCGLGQYEAFLNGDKVSENLLAPGWTDYDETTLYDTHEVTAQLQEGANAVGLALGNGMYHVQRRHRFAKFTGSFGPLRAILHLRLEYSDGSVEFVGTDESWRVHPGPITYNSIYGGEDFDARLDPTGCKAAGFNDESWTPAVAVVRPANTLKGFSVAAEPLRVIEVRQPVSEHPLPQPGVSVYDLGQNTSYMPRLRVNGPAGSTVRLTPAEILFEDGSIDRRTMGSTNRGISWWQYTLRGSQNAEGRVQKSETNNPHSATSNLHSAETWSPQFYYVGCRYLQAERLPAMTTGRDAVKRVPTNALPTIESLEGLVVHSTAEPVGEFECSNPLLNRIRDLVRWAQRANMVSVLTDCPHREKLGWLEQYHLNGPAIRYEFDMARMFTKGMNDMADAQTAEGMVPNIAPEYVEFSGPFRTAAEWSAAFILVPWQQYQFSADVELLRKHYPAMKRYFGWLESRAVDDIVSDGLGDWYDLGPEKLSRAELTPPPVTATAFYFYNARILSEIARVLGHKEDTQEFAAKAERIRASYNRAFFDPAKGSYATGSQCANALPLVMDIVEPQHREAVFASLVRDLEQRDYLMTAGDVGFRFLLQALADGGRSDMVYRMINRDDPPGYGYMLRMGATSLTESWDAKRTASHNHFMLGHITEWFYKDLAGIRCDPAGPGFKKIIIHPQPVDGVEWVKASYNSMHGRIVSEWAQRDGTFTLKVRIPANTSATVYVPVRPEESVAVGGDGEGADFLRIEDGRAVLGVGSGEFEFRSTP